MVLVEVLPRVAVTDSAKLHCAQSPSAPIIPLGTNTKGNTGTNTKGNTGRNKLSTCVKLPALTPPTVTVKNLYIYIYLRIQTYGSFLKCVDHFVETFIFPNFALSRGRGEISIWLESFIVIQFS